MNRHNLLFETSRYSVGFLPAEGWDTVMNRTYHCFYLHWHKELELLLLSGGRGEFTLDSQKYAVGDGDIVLISPQMLHYGIVSGEEPLHCRVIKMQLDLIGRHEEDLYQKYVAPFEKEKLVFTPVLSATDYPDVAQQINTVVSLFRSRSDAVILIKSELIKLYGLLIDHGLFTKQEKKSPQSSGDLKEIIHYIEANLTQKITVEDLAGIAGYSKYYFIRKFREQTGATVTEYVNSLRLSAAADLLLSTKLPVGMIGERAGIPNMPYFIKLFRREYSMTPLEFRKFYGKR